MEWYLKDVSKSIVLTHKHIWIYINTFHIYIICHKKDKVLFARQYNFNVSVSSPLESVTANTTVLASSPSPTVKVTESTTDTNSKSAMEADATSGKKNVYKNFVYNEFTLRYASCYIEKNGMISQRCL